MGGENSGLFTPPALGERGHRSLARRFVSPRHRIEAARKLRQVASSGPEATPARIRGAASFFMPAQTWPGMAPVAVAIDQARGGLADELAERQTRHGLVGENPSKQAWDAPDSCERCQTTAALPIATSAARSKGPAEQYQECLEEGRCHGEQE